MLQYKPLNTASTIEGLVFISETDCIIKADVKVGLPLCISTKTATKTYPFCFLKLRLGLDVDNLPMEGPHKNSKTNMRVYVHWMS